MLTHVLQSLRHQNRGRDSDDARGRFVSCESYLSIQFGDFYFGRCARAQINVPEPSTPEAKSIGGPKQDEWETLDASETPKLVPTSDVSDSKDSEKVVLQATEVTKLDINPRAVEAPGNMRLSSNAPAIPVEDITHHSSLEPSEPVDPHKSNTETLEKESDAGDESSQDAPMVPVWFGDLSRAGFDTSYLSLRDQLSDAAYWGRFDRMFSVLAEAERTYRQSWAAPE